MNTLHLFAGAGGGLLADLILGHTPIGAVEIDPYCCQLLRERKNDGWWPQLQVHEIDIRDFDPSEYAGRVDCVSGGFPCQDISVAGKGAGITGERSGLWSEFARILGVLRPRYAFIENSPVLARRGLDTVLSDLAAMGYDAEWLVVSAAQIGALHKRERIWILADTDSTGLEGWQCGRMQKHAGERLAGTCGSPPGEGGSGKVMADANRYGMEKRLWQDGQPGCGEISQSGMETDRSRKDVAESAIPEWWQSEPDVGRVAHGVAHRVHRLKALGNGQVPLQAAVAWKILSQQLLVR